MIRPSRSLFLLAIALLLFGCWDHQPPEKTAFILMIGLDIHPDRPDQYTVTQLAVLPSGLPSGENKTSSEGSPFYLLSNTAHTLEGAQLAIVDHLSRLPRLDHLDAIVISEEVARKGRAVEPAIAWALRHPQIRPGVFVFITDQTAQEFLDATPALDPLPGAALVRLMRHSERVPHIVPAKVYDFAHTILSPRRDGAIPLVRRINPLSVQVPPDFEQTPYVGFKAEGGGNGEGGSTEPMDTQITLAGMAIFKGQTMVGTIMREEGKGLRWIEGDSKVSLSIEHPEHSENFVAAVSIRSSAKRKARLEEENQVSLSIDIKASLDVWGEGKMTSLGIGPQKKQIQEEMQTTIETQVRQSMEILQQMKADIFGFAEELYRSSPRDWDKVAQQWDDLYAAADLYVDVDVKVRRTGLSR